MDWDATNFTFEFFSSLSDYIRTHRCLCNTIVLKNKKKQQQKEEEKNFKISQHLIIKLSIL